MDQFVCMHTQNWIFLERDRLFSNVHELDPSTGAIVSTTETLRTIVGAGVSTCAPTVIP